MNWPKYIILRLAALMMLLPGAVATATAQDTVYAGYATDLGVIAMPGDTYVWELYNDVTAINLATVPGNCPPSEAYFTGPNTGPTVNVMWVLPGTYYYKVTAYNSSGCMNLKVGKKVVLWEPPTAILATPAPVCIGDSIHLTVNLTGTAPWSITVTDGTNSWVYSNIAASPYTFTIPVVPLVTTSYWITSVTDAHVTNNIPSPPVIQVVNPKPVNSRIYQYGP